MAFLSLDAAYSVPLEPSPWLPMAYFSIEPKKEQIVKIPLSKFSK